MISILILDHLSDYRIGEALGCKFQMFGRKSIMEEGGSGHFSSFCPVIRGRSLVLGNNPARFHLVSFFFFFNLRINLYLE